MADQETTNTAALAIHVCSPDTAQDTFYSSAHGVKTSGSGDNKDIVVLNKKLQSDSSSVLKKNDEIIRKGSIQISTGKPEQAHGKMMGVINTDATDDLADIYISDEVLKQLRSQTEEKGAKTTAKTRRKLVKSQRKAIKTSALNSRGETDTNIKGHMKKMLKPSLRRKSSLSVNKSQFRERVDPMEFIVSNHENIGNKAENNNWMVDDEKSSDMHNNAVIQSYYGSMNTSYMDTIIQSSESLCGVCSLTKCAARNYKGVSDMLEPDISKEYSFKRADSSDDSGCFSNLSIQSINSPRSEDRDEGYEGYIAGGKSADKSNVSSDNSNKSVSLCSACGNEPQGHGSGLCKTCIGRIKYDGIRIGALGELRAYAQSIADSVKKILSISPKESKEVLTEATPPETDSKQIILKSGRTSVANTPGTQLQKCKTQISMSRATEDTRSKSLLNKSMSFDGRVARHLEENNKCSSVYWLEQDKTKLPISSCTLYESDEDKLLRNLDNVSDHAFIEGDYFSSSGKEIKEYLNQYDDINNKLEPTDKVKKRSYTKQRSCIEKVRSDADNGDHYLQPAIDPKKSQDKSKTACEFERGRSNISRMANTETKKSIRSSQKHEEDLKALNVFRLKVIHEGSPVDPLYTVRRGEDGKNRRVSLMRSATAPNKNHIPKKDLTEERSAVTRSSVKSKRGSTKLELKTRKSLPYVQEENRPENAQLKLINILDTQPESWRDDSSVMAVRPFIRKRSTSYDGSNPTSSKRNDSHRSISRSTIIREDKGVRQRRHDTSNDETSVQNSSMNEGRYSGKLAQPLRFSNRSMVESQTDAPLHAHSTIKNDAFTDSYRFKTLDETKKEFLYNEANDLMSSIPNEDKLMEVLESPKYYSHNTENMFSPQSKELSVITRDQPATSVSSYYCNIDQPKAESHIVSKKVLKFDSVDVNYILTGAGEQDTYHNQVSKYGFVDNATGNDCLWYSSHAGGITFNGRDGSHESKSSTSFHLVTAAKSSHSDVALMKHQMSWEHTSSRRQSMYSETDVDTGLIYHFAKRQTTRAHVPAFLDLTSSSKDIYTMSGDVSTSASSNSAISTKSDVSDSVYTGGFFKHDPFYDNDNKGISSSSSANSSTQLYFEPSSDHTKREPSELDIYTGALFSSSQNAISLGRAKDNNEPKASADAQKDGSTNNSTRPPLCRMSRRLKYRPHIDVINFKTTDSSSIFLSKHIEPNKQILASNISNNSCNCSDIEESEDSVYQGALVKRSKDSSYVGYNSGFSPVFQVKKVERPTPLFDYRKYENDEKVNPNHFFAAAPLEDYSNRDVWYTGFSMQSRDPSLLENSVTPELPVETSSHSWQDHDDYYRSSQRPRINKSNNCSDAQPDLEASDTNNSHLEDIYTGFFEGQTKKTYPTEQTYNCRKTSSEHWYADQPRRSYSSTNFFDEGLTKSEPARKPNAADYESTEGAYSSTSVFGQANAAYSWSKTYMAQNGWREYDLDDTLSTNNYKEESPKFTQLLPESTNIGEKYSYFQYISNQGPDEDNYQYDKGTYSFDQRDPIPEKGINEIRKVGGIVCRENVANKEDYAEDVNRDLEQGAWMPFTFRHDEKPRHVEETNVNRPDIIPDLYKATAMSSNEKHNLKYFEESSYNQDRIYDNDGARNKWREMTTKGIGNVIKGKDPAPLKGHSAGDSKAHLVGDSKAHLVGDSKAHLMGDSKAHLMGDSKAHLMGDSKAHLMGDSKAHQVSDAKTHLASDSKTHSAGDSKRQDYVKTGAWNPPDQIPDRARGKRIIPSTPKSPVVEGSKGNSTTSNVISSVTSIPSRLTNYVKKWF